MKRRQFIKSTAAAISAPALPAHGLFALPFSEAQYAAAVEAAGRWAYTTPAYLKLTLKVDDNICDALLRRLQADGILGREGPGGLFCATRVTDQPMVMAKQLAERAQALVPKAESGDMGKPESRLRLEDLEVSPSETGSIQDAEAEDEPVKPEPERELSCNVES